jgi:hypothetical protein
MDDPKRCCYCGEPAATYKKFDLVFTRAWCRECLDRIRITGVVDWHEYPTEDEGMNSGVPGRLVVG